MTEAPRIVAFTGHRPGKLGGYDPNPMQDQIRALLRRELQEIKPACAVSGMALGVDQWAAEICNGLAIPWVAAVPFEGQEWLWPSLSQMHYHNLLRTAVRVVTVSPGGYSARKMQARNEWMVDWANILLAVWDGSPGGTANCIDYARRRGDRYISTIYPGLIGR